jgi:hypothetical protein
MSDAKDRAELTAATGIVFDLLGGICLLATLTYFVPSLRRWFLEHPFDITAAFWGSLLCPLAGIGFGAAACRQGVKQAGLAGVALGALVVMAALALRSFVGPPLPY